MGRWENGLAQPREISWGGSSEYFGDNGNTKKDSNRNVRG